MASNDSDRQSVRQDGSRLSGVLSFIERRLNRTTISKSDNVVADDVKGSLGLNLLHEPLEASIDFVFVHGLGGGSRKTWSFSADPAQFWPKEWLPRKKGFENVRIHSYGYNSQWQNKGNVLNIHDFGRKLIGTINNSPLMGRNSKTRIIFIGHSMGGIVIKKACLLAKRDPSYSPISNRISGIFFLATPHRGADSVYVLRRLLRMPGMHGPKAYADDIVPNATTLQEINDGFRTEYSDIPLWSFFETKETDIGFSSQMIVEKESASLGLPLEHIYDLDADHRHMCKFKDRSDVNYITLSNTLLLAVDGNRNGIPSKREEHRDQMRAVSEYLCVSQHPETELSTISDKQAEGSCSWLTARPTFRAWFDGKLGDLKIPAMLDMIAVPKNFWLSGKPGTGKSITAAHVIKHIESFNFDCSFYFFKSGDSTRSNLSGLLRSLAYQMACHHSEIRQAILTMVQEGEYLNKDDHNAIWRGLFLSRIFRCGNLQPHYWVIDALDECSGYSALFPLLSKIRNEFPLRLFVTSRSTPSINRCFMQQNIPVLVEQITVEDSLKDIDIFLRQNTSLLPVEDESSRYSLISQMVQKSNGCFLWAALVLKELETVHSVNQIWNALNDVPVEMNDLYADIVKRVASVSANVNLAKAILRWTIFAAKPLTVEELNEALYLDINDMVPRLESVIGSICGHLVYVDKDSRVYPVHQTVISFLTKQTSISEFLIDKRAEHSRISEVCLAYLSEKGLQNPNTKLWNTVAWPKDMSLFANYTSLHFSYHLAHSSSDIDAPLLLLDSFLKSNVLTWIEIVAASGNLAPLTQAAKDFRAYLARRAKYRSPLGKEVQAVNAWANDFIHIGALFGRSLLSAPASIHSLIPPVCPPSSQIYKTFGNYANGLKTVGIPDKEWDDRLTCYIYPEERALSIACCDSYFAVGLSNGVIMLYRSSTFEYLRKLNHGDPAEKLVYANLSTMLASGSPGKVILWNTHTGATLWEADIHSRLTPMALSFNDDDSVLMLAMENSISFFQVSDGKETGLLDFYTRDDTEAETCHGQSSMDAQFSPGYDFLAIIYRNKPITFWNLTHKRYHSQLVKKGSEEAYSAPQVNSIAFHPNPEVRLAAIAYNDGDLVVVDYLTGKQIALLHTLAQIVAVSPDGRTLATDDEDGAINLFNFETLRLMYRITVDDYMVQGITFASNSLRFFDIRGDHCNIWEPSVLVWKEGSDDSSSEPYSEEVPPSALHVDSMPWNSDRVISAIVDHHGGDYLFCGRTDGSIAVYEADSGNAVHELYKHAADIKVILLDWNSTEGILTSVDESCRFISRKLTYTKEGSWKTGPRMLDKRRNSQILQILTSPDGKYILVSTVRSDIIWTLGGTWLGTKVYEEPMPRRWITHPCNSNRLLLIENGKLYVFEWSRFEMVSKEDGIMLETKATDLFPSLAVTCRDGINICVSYSTGWQGVCSNELELWDVSQIDQNPKGLPLSAHYTSFASKIKAIIGVYKSVLFFIDVNSWVCSINIGNLQPAKSYSRHFFIPFTWHSKGEVIFHTTVKGSIALAYKDGLVVFHRGVEFEDAVTFENQGDMKCI